MLELTAPEFTELGYEGGFSDNDTFYYYFSLELWDTDTSKPLTVRLQYADMYGNNWQDCPDEGDSVVSLTYNDTDGFGSCELIYDMNMISLDSASGEYGLLRQVRIACEYTLTDGTEGIVYSSDVGELYAYKGEYVTSVPDTDGYIGTLDEDKLYVTFQLITDLLFDPQKIELEEVSIKIGDSNIEIDPELVTMSSPNTDGTFTLSCPTDDFLDKENMPETGENDSVRILLNYIDKDYTIMWESEGQGKIRVNIVNSP